MTVLCRRKNSRLSEASLKPRTSRVTYIDAVAGAFRLVSDPHRARGPRTSLSILDEEALLDTLGDAGLRVAAHWDPKEYARTRDEDVLSLISRVASRPASPGEDRLVVDVVENLRGAGLGHLQSQAEAAFRGTRTSSTQHRGSPAVEGDRSSLLDELGRKYNTDKASKWVPPRGAGKAAKGHAYLGHYQTSLAPLRARGPGLLLDLGIGVGGNDFASAQMWRDYLPGWEVVAVDIRKPAVEVPNGVAFRRGNLGDARFLVELAREFSPTVVVDDASHKWPHQILSLLYLLPAVEPGGAFILEDLQTSGQRLATDYSLGMSVSPVELLSAIQARVAVATSDPARSDVTTDLAMQGVAAPLVEALARLIDRVEIIRGAAIIHRAA